MERGILMIKHSKNFSMQWHITDACNLNCRHCYRDEKVQDLSLEDNIKVFNNIRSLAKKMNNRMDISLTGGEAITYYAFEDLVKYLRADEIVDEIHLQTNGTMIDDKLLKILSENKIGSVQISIDGTEPIHDYMRGEGTFKKSISGIKILKNHGIETQVHCVLTKLNYNSIFELIDYLNDIGVDTFLATHLVPIGAGKDIESSLITKEDWKNYQMGIMEHYPPDSTRIKVLKGRPTWNLICDEYGSACPVGINSVCVVSNGDMLLCRRMPIKTGNLLTESIFSIWYNNDDYWKLRDRRNLKGKCGSCDQSKKCSGCRALAYAINGDYLAEDPYCWKEVENND